MHVTGPKSKNCRTYTNVVLNVSRSLHDFRWTTTETNKLHVRAPEPVTLAAHETCIQYVFLRFKFVFFFSHTFFLFLSLSEFLFRFFFSFSRCSVCTGSLSTPGRPKLTGYARQLLVASMYQWLIDLNKQNGAGASMRGAYEKNVFALRLGAWEKL